MKCPPGSALGLFLGALWAGSLGCTLRIPAAPIEPHLAPLSRHGPSSGPRLGVGVFVDARDIEGRLEVHPPLRLRGMQLVREGEVRSGDASFIGEVVAGIRRDAQATLLRAGLFSSIRSIESNDADALAWRVGPDLDWVLTATLEDFGAVQHQYSVLNPLRVGWLRNRFEVPQGFVRIRYRLYDRSGLRYRYRIDASHVSAGQQITQAALDAMAVANEQLVRHLYADLGTTSAGTELRVVPLRVLDACALGPRHTAELIREASEVLEREAGIRIRHERERWRPPDPDVSVEAVLKGLRAAVPAGDGIVVALIPRPESRASVLAEEHYGLATPFAQHAVVGCDPEWGSPVLTLIHELAHLFGAVHVRDRSSVMYAAAEFDARFFDPLNRRILRASRQRPFGAPLDADTALQLRAIYRAASRVPGCCDPGALDAVREALSASVSSSEREPSH